MKVEESRDATGVACPSCGHRFGESLVETEPGTEVIHSDDPTRSIPDPNELFGGEDIDLIKKEPKVTGSTSLPNSLPESMVGPSSTLVSGATSRPAPADSGLPTQRREEYKMPELISGIGERPRAPGATPAGAVPLDSSRIGSTDDERLAVEVDDEEGKIQTHVARKITGWDLEDEEDDQPEVLDQRPKWVKLAVPIGIGAVGLLFFSLLIYGVVWSGERIVEGAEDPEDSVPELLDEAELARQDLTENERMALDDPEGTYAMAGKVIGSFLEAKNYKERLQYVRDAERLEPIMKEYYTRNPDLPIGFREPEKGWFFESSGSFLVGNIILENFGNHGVAVEWQEEDGRYLVDWESFVAYSEIPWEEIKKRRIKEPFILRARASIAAYFNFGFAEGEWACIQLQDMSSDHTIYGYIKLKDPLLGEMGRIMSRKGASHVTVKVRHPEDDGNGDNQLLVTEVIASGWVFKREEEPEEDEPSELETGGDAPDSEG